MKQMELAFDFLLDAKVCQSLVTFNDFSKRLCSDLTSLYFKIEYFLGMDIEKISNIFQDQSDQWELLSIKLKLNHGKS